MIPNHSKSFPLISICIPVYNAEAYLEQAVQGILNQSYTNLELVICDNCSTDQSAEIAKQYAKKDDRIKFIQNNWNIGYSGNVFKATSMAMGDFILFHAADDLMETGALENYVQVIREELDDNFDRLVILSDFYTINSTGEKEKVSYLIPDTRILTSSNMEEYPLGEHDLVLGGLELNRQYFPVLTCFGWVGTVMFSKQLFNQVEGYLNSHWINPDKFFIYKLLSRDPIVHWLRKPLFCYRIHNTNQNSQQAQTGVLKYLLDEYAFTFEFPSDFYKINSAGKDKVIRFFIEHDCLDSALVKMANGERKLGFRYLSFALATYPDITWKSSKTYFAIIAWLLGPLGSFIAGLFYKTGFWTNFLKKSK